MEVCSEKGTADNSFLALVERLVSDYFDKGHVMYMDRFYNFQQETRDGQERKQCHLSTFLREISEAFTTKVVKQLKLKLCNGVGNTVQNTFHFLPCHELRRTIDNRKLEDLPSCWPVQRWNCFAAGRQCICMTWIATEHRAVRATWLPPPLTSQRPPSINCQWSALSNRRLEARPSTTKHSRSQLLMRGFLPPTLASQQKDVTRTPPCPSAAPCSSDYISQCTAGLASLILPVFKLALSLTVLGPLLLRTFSNLPELLPPTSTLFSSHQRLLPLPSPEASAATATRGCCDVNTQQLPETSSAVALTFYTPC
ncbi:hypothetical protein PR048_006257 [Dryococelus australis]|uniref:Uncharacterized protein n=1 Tax=Dryococelus australis TaxID=614101 RepID=A0ABQ9IAF9_9NEOP|nr:hypothetical protein PR048_006257 [Dryococelus australis]